MSKRHVFTVAYDRSGLHLDTYVAVEWPWQKGMGQDDLDAVKAIAGDDSLKELDEFLRGVEGIMIRTRFSLSEGPFVVIDDDGWLTAETIESTLRSMTKERREQWLRTARL